MNDLLRELAEVRRNPHAWSTDTQHATPRDEELAKQLASTIDILASLTAKVATIEERLNELGEPLKVVL